MKHDETEAIWAGDERRVEELASQYSKRKSVLLEYANELYLFRRHPKYAARLIGLAADLMGCVRRINIKSKKCRKNRAVQYADEANLLATVLEWLSHEFVPGFESTHLLCAAFCVSGSGMGVVKRFPVAFANHLTPVRLKVIAAKIALSNREITKANMLMYDVGRAASVLDDGCQRARVLREAGLVCRNNGMPVLGMFLAVRALLVWGVPFDEHRKSLGAIVFAPLAI